VAIIVALTTLGLDIGPLLVGLGVVGIAIGFGAQGLVRDVISGIFFLMEDAFRVGELADGAISLRYSAPRSRKSSKVAAMVVRSPPSICSSSRPIMEYIYATQGPAIDPRWP
jgi:small-conductance mechanosensitive channel